MKMKWILLSATIVCILVAVGTDFAQPQEQPARPVRPAAAGIGAGMFEGLDLTQEQQARIAEIRESMMEKIRNADTPEARREVFTQMREQMQSVLTEEQIVRMRSRAARPAEAERPAVGERLAARGDAARPSPEARARTMDQLQLFDAVAGRLELTEEQQAKIAKLREEAFKKLMQDIKAVLTDTQKERLTQAQERLRAAQARPRAEGERVRQERPEAKPEARRETRPEAKPEARRERPERKPEGQPGR